MVVEVVIAVLLVRAVVLVWLGFLRSFLVEMIVVLMVIV